MKTALIIIGIILFLYLVYCIIATTAVVHFITNPHHQTREERRQKNHEKGLDVGTEIYDRKDIIFTMPDGYEIHGDITLNNPQKFMLFCHGHGSNREGTIKFTKMFYDMGYSLVLYDHRGHGDNKKHRTTMGIRESKDLAEIVKKIKEMYGKDIEIGLLGYSMGAATVCMATQYLQDDVKFVISDCSYSSLANQCFSACLIYHVPFGLTSWFINIEFRIRFGISYRDCKVKEVLSNSKLPICIFHGKKDKKVFPKNADTLYNESTSKIKRLHYFEGAGHAECVEIDPVSYKEKVKEFIESIGE